MERGGREIRMDEKNYTDNKCHAHCSPRSLTIPSLNQFLKVDGHPVLLPGKFHGQRSLVGYSSWGPKESETTE